MILEDEEAAKTKEIPEKEKYAVVVQTTFRQAKFDKILEILQDRGVNMEVHNTICSATENGRQKQKNCPKP